MALSFRDRVAELVRQVPAGRVSTYSDIAHALGSPRAARQVGWALSDLPAEAEVPWWRIVKSSGHVPLHHSRELQADLLRAEGVEVDESGKIEMRRYLWDPGH
jgi:methylated-DNA-protein-cysteine methyltransferase-like protein